MGQHIMKNISYPKILDRRSGIQFAFPNMTAKGMVRIDRRGVKPIETRPKFVLTLSDPQGVGEHLTGWELLSHESDGRLTRFFRKLLSEYE